MKIGFSPLRCIPVYCLYGDLLCLRTRASAPVALLALPTQALALAPASNILSSKFFVLLSTAIQKLVAYVVL